MNFSTLWPQFLEVKTLENWSKWKILKISLKVLEIVSIFCLQHFFVAPLFQVLYLVTQTGFTPNHRITKDHQSLQHAGR